LEKRVYEDYRPTKPPKTGGSDVKPFLTAQALPAEHYAGSDRKKDNSL
jgi:hypothetical protein